MFEMNRFFFRFFCRCSHLEKKKKVVYFKNVQNWSFSVFYYSIGSVVDTVLRPTVAEPGVPSFVRSLVFSELTMFLPLVFLAHNLSAKSPPLGKREALKPRSVSVHKYPFVPFPFSSFLSKSVSFVFLGIFIIIMSHE